jgi:ketosteroid isomerase-like protein
MADGLDVLDKVRRDYVAAANAGDIEAFKATLAEDIVGLPPDTPKVTGRTAFADFINDNFFIPFEIDFDAQFEDGAVDGTNAWTRGFYTLDVTPRAGGDKIAIRGKFVNHFRQDGNGDWKYTCLIWNTDAPVDAG